MSQGRLKLYKNRGRSGATRPENQKHWVWRSFIHFESGNTAHKMKRTE